MSDEKSMVESMAATMSGLVRVCQTLAKDRDDRDGNSAWREEMANTILEEARKHVSLHPALAKEPMLLLLIYEGVKLGLAPDLKAWATLERYSLN